MATTRDKRPILSSRISAFQGANWPYLGKILHTVEVVFVCIFIDLGRFGTWTENPRVGGSIPPLATNVINHLRLYKRIFFAANSG